MACWAVTCWVLEAVAHRAAIKLFGLRRFSTPGMVIAVLILPPISVYAFGYVARNGLLPPWGWIGAFF